MIHHPTDNNGFLLRPVDESLFSADSSACVDLLSNFTLSFTYNINPESATLFRVPRRHVRKRGDNDVG